MGIITAIVAALTVRLAPSGAEDHDFLARLLDGVTDGSARAKAMLRAMFSTPEQA